LEAANLKEGDDVEWIDNDDGTFILKKSVKQLNHDESIAAGWTMTDDGFWIKE
jgi:bifunctional DNA-binding transcriptional regulator/antitoxin component of YhaV-PrlF toxin-antitoxin module